MLPKVRFKLNGTMQPPETVLKLLIALPLAILFLYSLIIFLGNHWILRAGGSTAHENYPKVVSQFKSGFIFISVIFVFFFLVIFGYIPSEAVVALTSVAAGVFGTLAIKDKGK